MISTLSWGGLLTGCLAVIVIIAAIAAVRYLLLNANSIDDERLESGGTS